MIRKRGSTYEVRAYDPTRKKNVYVGSRRRMQEARELEREKEAEFQRHRLTRLTVREFADQWLTLFPRPKDTTNAHNQERISRFVADYGDRQLDSIGRLEARAWALQNPGRLLAVRALFSDAVRAGVTAENPFAALGIERGGRKRQLKPDWLTQEEVHALADTAIELWDEYGRHFRALVLFAAYTGVRPGELFALDWSDLDGDEAHVRRQIRPDGTFGTPKNGEPRTIVVPTPAMDVLAAAPVLSDEHVFATITGKRFRRGSHYPYWQKLAAAAGRPSMDFYELRHFGATQLLEMGLSDWDVSIQLGHRDGGVQVREVYGHPSHARARARIKAVWQQEAVAA